MFVTLETEEGKGTDLVPGRAQTRVVKTVGEVDWDGKKVWDFRQRAGRTRAAASRHRAPAQWQYARPLQHRLSAPGFAAPEVLDDVAYEVNADGNIVWTWRPPIISTRSASPPTS